MSIIGKKVGMLKVIKRLEGSKALCLCDCGNGRVVSVGHFNAGYFKSCGCHVVRHGHAGSGTKKRSREYISYYNMIARCHKKTNKRYKDYGAKGIVVCGRWRDSFVNFLNDMGPCPDGYTIDRVDNSGIYEPRNCRWVSRAENQNNRANSKRWVVNGIIYNSCTDAARSCGCSHNTIRAWCLGRVAAGRTYKRKENCYVIDKYA